MDFDRDAPREPHRYARYNEGGYYDGPRGSRVFLVLMAIFWLGAGLSLIGAAGYLYWDSQQTDGAWVYVRPSFENNPEVAVAAAARGPSPLGEQAYTLVIDKIGVNAPVAPFGLDAEAVPEVPYEKDLVAWYTFSALPGTGENAVFAAHYTWEGEAVFYRLGELQVGDAVVLRGENGAELVYRVSETQLIEPSVDTAVQWMQPASADVITLITCGGERFEMPGTRAGAGYTQRQIVRAEYVASQPAA